MRDPDRHAPVFVLSPARGNSSVCVTVLGAHPQMYGFPELILFNAPTLGAVLAPDLLLAAEGEENTHAGLYRALAQTREGRQDREALQRAKDWVATHPDWTVAQVFDRLLDDVSPLIGIEKSPESSFSHGSLARMRNLYPRARFIHLTRHPVPSIRSMQRHWQGRRWWPTGPDRPGATLCAQTWRDTHRRIADFLASVPPELHRRVRSEDLLDPARPDLERVLEWLGLRTDADALAAVRHPELSPYAAPGPDGFFGGLDPTFLLQPHLRRPDLPDEVRFPVEWGIDRWVQADVAILAAELSYA